MEKNSNTDHVRYEEVLQRLRKERNVFHKMRRRKNNWIGLSCVRIVLLKALFKARENKG
jgi:hypothetical protein